MEARPQHGRSIFSRSRVRGVTEAAHGLEPAWRRARPYGMTSGWLFTASVLPPSICSWGASRASAADYAIQTSVVAVSAILLASGFVLPTRPSVGRGLAALGGIALLALALPALGASPFLALSALLAGIGALAQLWNVGGILGGRMRYRGQVLRDRARGAAFGALGIWFYLTFREAELAPLDQAVLGAALAISLGLTLAWAWLERREHPRRAVGILLTPIALAGIGILGSEDPVRLLDLSTLAVGIGALSLPIPIRSALKRTSWWEPLLGHPERLFVGTFAGLCFIGAVLLALPASTTGAARVAFIDALFTSVSAVCVTGLIVLDTPADLTGFGQVALLGMIQLGGLGIMTFSTAALRVFGGRMSLRHEGAIASLISPRDRSHIFDSAQRILLVTATTEAIGALVLWLRFLGHGDSFGTALWRATFTAVSAFCNAGFALQSDSLVSYQSDPWVLHCVALLIIVGGLAPAVVFALPTLVRRRASPVAVQVKLSLAAAASMLALGFVLTLAFEWDGALGALSIPDRIHNAWFHSATLRTAGFNAIDLSTLRPATLSIMLIWMFVGGNPGGTAGGIKTTTAAVLVLGVLSAVRGHWDVTVFGRRLAPRTLQKATVVATLGMAAVFFGILALQLTQDISSRDAIFEVVSASATVGLSLGATSALDEVGKLIIIGCMFAGRVGPLTILMFLSQRQVRSAIRRPEEEIDVG